MQNFTNKNIWIVGASSGIGLELAKLLHNKGAKLILSARNKEALDSLNSQLEGKHKVLPLDVTDAQALKAAATSNKLDSAIFMAGIYDPKPISQLTSEQCKKTIDINIGGAFNFVNAVLPVMQAQKHGQIVLCGSIAGYRGLTEAQPYCATKAAIINLAESLKLEMRKTNIDVKLISPGFVKTRLTDKNNFKMPFIITAEKAALYIEKGLTSGKFEIHFPKRMTYIFKLIKIMPFWLFKRVM